MATRRRRLIWSRRARDALDDAATYVAENSIEAAVDLVERAFDAAESLRTLSDRGHIVPELNDPSVREIFVHNKYRLIYEVTASQVIILGFLHGARDFNRWRRGS
jgi:plasmid stabilization system protein ParE